MSQTRFQIVQESLLYNIKYAEKNKLDIVICMFNSEVVLFTNISIGDKSKELCNKLLNKCFIIDKLTYEQMIESINNSHAKGGTNFVVPFELLSCIKEIDTTSEIFFLSDGYNNAKLSDKNLNNILAYKHRITSLGVGNESSYDKTLLSQMSKDDETLEGKSADIIQQELLAQMTDVSMETLDLWKNVKLTLMSKNDNLKVGLTGVQVFKITEDEYMKTNFVQDSENANLILTIGSKNNIMIRKETPILTADVVSKKNMTIYIADCSGSMDEYADLDYKYKYKYNNSPLSLAPPMSPSYAPSPVPSHAPSPVHSPVHSPVPSPVPPLDLSNIHMVDSGPVLAPTLELDQENTDEEPITEYIKYTMDLNNMKSYQRIIFSYENSDFKAQITWTDSDNKEHTMILHDLTKYNKITDPIIDQSLDIANNIGHYINISNLSNKDDQIGNFRTINQIINKYASFMKQIVNEKTLSDFSLMELLFYNKKQGLKLYRSTMTYSEKNMHELMKNTSAGARCKLLAASATMSAVCNQTPSTQAQPEENDNVYSKKDKDIVMCSICYGNPREFIFSCGHCYTCKKCAEQVLASTPKNKCSYCKDTVTWIRKIIMTNDQKNMEHYYKCINQECYNIASIVSKCPTNSEKYQDDSGFHLTYCQKCFSNVKRDYKKLKKTHACFCGHEITSIVSKIYFT